MTELETMQRAKMYLDKLARGIDPITDREMPEDSVLNHVRLARCFYYVSDVLEQVIRNGGSVGARKKTVEFAITPEQLRRVQLSEYPVRITQLADAISMAIGDPEMKKLKATVITDWLMARGFLEMRVSPDGKNQRHPTPRGFQLGIFTQKREGRHGDYEAVLYNTEAQKFILEHLMEMLSGEVHGC